MSNKFIRKVADSFSSEFAEFCAGDERMHELMMELAGEFMVSEAPVLDEETQTDVACELIMSVTVTKVWRIATMTPQDPCGALWYTGKQRRHHLDKQLQNIIVSIVEHNPTAEVKHIILPSATKNKRKMSLRGRRSCNWYTHYNTTFESVVNLHLLIPVTDWLV